MGPGLKGSGSSACMTWYSLGHLTPIALPLLHIMYPRTSDPVPFVTSRDIGCTEFERTAPEMAKPNPNPKREG